MKKVQDRIIVALDTHRLSECERWLRALKGKATFFKVGMELFYANGRRAVDLVHEIGGKVFLDLKFCDIPNTVAQAVRVTASWGVEMLNLHTLGGSRMMKAAREAVNGLPVRRRPLLLGVTILTSLEEKDLKNEMGIGRPLKKEVLHLAGLARKSGLDGVVASAQEASLLKRRFGKNFTIVTPGIRPAGSEQGDQKRWVTPKEAFRLGSDYVVIGRPITRADDPAEAFAEIVKSISLPFVRGGKVG